VGFLASRPARRQPTSHQLLPHRATAPETHSPSPVEVYEASSRLSRNWTNQADAATAERIPHACPSSSDRRPKTNGSGESWSGEGLSRRSARLDADSQHIVVAFGRRVHRLAGARIEDK